MIEILPESEGAVVALRVSGRLTHDDYAGLTPELERRVAAHGKLSCLCDLTAFSGIEARAVWDDLVFGLRHFRDFARMAVVADRAWIEWWTKAAGSLMPVEVRCFPPRERAEAWAWVRGRPSEGAE